jgi:hypothetical protein
MHIALEGGCPWSTWRWRLLQELCHANGLSTLPIYPFVPTRVLKLRTMTVLQSIVHHPPQRVQYVNPKVSRIFFLHAQPTTEWVSKRPRSPQTPTNGLS